jgi:hypothetical protein
MTRTQQPVRDAVGSSFTWRKKKYFNQFRHAEIVPEASAAQSWLGRLFQDRYSRLTVPAGPIRSVELSAHSVGGGDSESTVFDVTYFIPDRRLASIRDIKKWRASTVRRRAFPVFGRTRFVEWEGFPTFLVHALNQGTGCVPPITEKEVEVTVGPAREGWSVMTSDSDGWRIPSEELWACLQAIGSKISEGRFPFDVYS